MLKVADVLPPSLTRKLSSLPSNATVLSLNAQKWVTQEAMVAKTRPPTILIALLALHPWLADVPFHLMPLTVLTLQESVTVPLRRTLLLLLPSCLLTSLPANATNQQMALPSRAANAAELALINKTTKLKVVETLTVLTNKPLAETPHVPALTWLMLLPRHGPSSVTALIETTPHPLPLTSPWTAATGVIAQTRLTLPPKRLSSIAHAVSHLSLLLARTRLAIALTLPTLPQRHGATNVTALVVHPMLQ